MNDTLIAVDLAKTVFEIAVSRAPGRVCERKRLSRSRFLGFFATRPPSTVVMEACGSAHFWARKLKACGHDVALLPPSHGRPYIRRNKTDRTDAKGILEAFRNEEIRRVPVKSVHQHTLAALHRVRSAWMAARTARINTMRGVLRELGFVIPEGATRVVPAVRLLIADADAEIPDALRPTLEEMCLEIRDLERRCGEVERQLKVLAKGLPIVKRLMEIPGIGLLTATALVAFVGNVQRFPSGRHFASYIGLTPHERSSGLRRRLGAISKRGDTYIRTLLVHGARAALLAGKRVQQPDRLRSWALEVEQRRGHNKAAVALAYKLARTAWVVWKKGVRFQAIAV